MRGLSNLSLVLLALFFLSSCTYQYAMESIPVWSERLEFSERHTLSTARGLVLARDSQICVHSPIANTPVTPEATISRDLATSLQPYFRGVYLIQQSANYQNSLAESKRMGCGFLLYPQFVLEDFQSSLGELQEGVDERDDVGFDRLYLALTTWDVPTNQWVDTTYLKSRTQFFKLSSHQSLELVDGALDAYVKQVVASH